MTDQAVAAIEQDMMQDMYSKMSDACYKLCITKSYKQEELHKGETVCLDRCVSKYIQTHETLGAILGELTAQTQADIEKFQKK